MLLQEKIKLFETNALVEDFLISINEKAAFNVKVNASQSEHFIFEQNVDFQSFLVSNGNPCFLGAHSYMNGDGYIRGFVFVGRYCSIGRRVTLGAGMHNTEGLSTSPRVQSIPTPGYSGEERLSLSLPPKNRRNKFTIIENDVWIGDGAVILPGVRIETGAVIAANSVITKNVRPYEIVGGTPQRVIRKRFPEEISNSLIMPQWSEFEPTELSKMPTKNILAFIKSTTVTTPKAQYPSYRFY